MAFITMGIYSEALGMQTQVNIVMPQKNNMGEIGVTNKDSDKKLKCLYLLHGLSDDQTIWMRRTSIERYATEHGICVIMPLGAKSFYSDMKYGLKYYTYIAKELPNILESMFNISSKREDRYIGGLSMGGYGALKIAITEQGRYSAAFGLSSVSDIFNSNFTEVLIPVFGGEIPKSADLFELVKEHDGDELKPRIYMTVGKDDFMYDDNIRLSEVIKRLNYDYTFIETEGTHCWNLWDKTIQNALEWMLK